MIPIIDGIINLATGWINGKQEKQKLDLELQLEQMRIDAKKESAPDDYDMEAMKNQEHSWKDEYLLWVFTIPFVLSFVPQTQEAVVKGWHYIALAPWWYPSLLIGITASVYGLRWYFGDKKFNYFTSKDLPTDLTTEAK
ncbi:MAG: hypothetical protein HKK66_03265 [Chlorobiaceae bacterium]|nr:hypothetical protein [Chlorobiaceae bacterium]